MNKNKAQGTAFETWTRKALNALNIKARRLAEGDVGRHDGAPTPVETATRCIAQ